MGAVPRITATGRSTVPKEVRTALRLSPGDRVLWDVESDGTVRVRRLGTEDEEYLRADEGTLSESGEEADEEAYSDF